jgi:hypothetical protein
MVPEERYPQIFRNIDRLLVILAINGRIREMKGNGSDGCCV